MSSWFHRYFSLPSTFVDENIPTWEKLENIIETFPENCTGKLLFYEIDDEEERKKSLCMEHSEMWHYDGNLEVHSTITESLDGIDYETLKKVLKYYVTTHVINEKLYKYRYGYIEFL